MSETERVQWEARYRTEGRLASGASLFVTTAVSNHSTRPGRALDVGGGTGRNAVWLAEQGWSVTVVDVSPTALALAEEDATQAGVALTTIAADLDVDPLPAGPWDLIVVHHYLNRPLFRVLAASLRPGGLLVFAQPTVENLKRHDRPGPAHSLESGEALQLVTELDVLSYVEGWTPEGRHEAQLVAQRPVSG
jgi:tellurite methyltransferase